MQGPARGAVLNACGGLLVEPCMFLLQTGSTQHSASQAMRDMRIVLLAFPDAGPPDRTAVTKNWKGTAFFEAGEIWNIRTTDEQ
jgi:hypothetical protein